MTWWKIAARSLKCSIPILRGLENHRLAEYVREGRDFLYFDNPYFGTRGTSRCRVIRGGVHLQTVLNRPPDRAIQFGAACAAWKGGREVVVLPPSDYAAHMFGAEDWLDEKMEWLRQRTDRPILIKRKQEGPLWPLLLNAHCLVDYGSMGAVEALRLGVPVFAGPMSPALPVSAGEDIEVPIYPDRDAWLRSLAYATWDISELGKLEDYEYSYFHDL